MKKFLLYYLVLCSTQLLAVNKDFLKCLGSEEKNFHHKKLAGPYLKLNEDLMSAFIQMSETLTIQNKYQKEICSSPSDLASLKTLELILVHKRNVFISRSNKNDIVQGSLDKYGTDEIISTAIHAFITLINNIQAQSNKANCVIKNIPEIKSFYFKTQHIQEEVGLLKLLNEIQDLKTVFKKLNSRELIKICSK